MFRTSSRLLPVELVITFTNTVAGVGVPVGRNLPASHGAVRRRARRAVGRRPG
jgi:hypothetical protein